MEVKGAADVSLTLQQFALGLCHIELFIFTTQMGPYGQH
jgi:hypothetical protein